LHGITGDGSYGRILVHGSGSSILLEQRDINNNIIGSSFTNQELGDNKWHHIVYSLDGSFVRLYVNGVIQGNHVACNGIKKVLADYMSDEGRMVTITPMDISPTSASTTLPLQLKKLVESMPKPKTSILRESEIKLL